MENLRKSKSLNYEKMAQAVGISKVYYWQIENKKRRIYYELAKKIAKVFGLKPDDIFYNDFE